mmetsp:Transcript_28993/g.27776  ORF Transcript_28993/g.27776 Transcript_28993/m.27776 type:complete len:145 (+) Transcript_28993:451-885(+)
MAFVEEFLSISNTNGNSFILPALDDGTLSIIIPKHQEDHIELLNFNNDIFHTSQLHIQTKQVEEKVSDFASCKLTLQSLAAQLCKHNVVIENVKKTIETRNVLCMQQSEELYKNLCEMMEKVAQTRMSYFEGKKLHTLIENNLG